MDVPLAELLLFSFFLLLINQLLWLSRLFIIIKPTKSGQGSEAHTRNLLMLDKLN